MPQLRERNVRLIGVGLEEMGAKEFVLGGFFKGGELFIDTEVRVFCNSMCTISETE